MRAGVRCGRFRTLARMRADLHLHSKASGPAAEWLFRRIGLPESYSEPASLHDLARERGMDVFTLTDRDTLDGCLAIAGRPGVILGEEVTAQFPEDRTKVRVLVWGLDEGDHREIQRHRENIYDLQRFLDQRGLAHAVAHPLHDGDGRLRVAHLEKLILLFRHFEGINGSRDALTSEVARCIFSGLTREKIEALANLHGITPTHDRAWEKAFIGGSSDGSGIFAAGAWTETESATNAKEFLAEIRAGRCKAGGAGGTPLAHAHGLYGSVFRFASEKFAGFDGGGLVGKAFSRFMEGENPTEFSFGEKLGFLAQGIVNGQIFELAKPKRASLWKQFSTTFRDSELQTVLAQATANIAEPERRAFITACLFADRLLYRFFSSFVKKLSGGKLIEAVQDVSMLAPVALSLAPYFTAFRRLAPDRAWLGEVSQAFTGGMAPPLRNTKRAWFTDTLEDVNGVATTIRRMTAACVENGDPLTVVTSRGASTLTGIPLQNFEPVGEFELPEYELQKLSFPPLLKILDFIQRENFTELIISTPGPVGLTALLAARLLGLRTAGIYHTDFPQYVRILTDDRSWETLTWSFMRWFYAQMDTIWVNSESYRQSWIDRGLSAEKLRILPRGLDTQLYRADRRSPDFWPKRGAVVGSAVLLYVGRISKEKNLDVIVASWERLKIAGKEAGAPQMSLAFVGDGPFLSELRLRIPDAIFTGYLAGETLAQAFASADVFLFPSTTDTFGNVVIEAQACGLPCIVSNVGGPKDLVAQNGTGIITRGLDVDDFTAAVARLVRNPALRAEMGAAAAKSVASRDWRDAARRWWDATL
jgi:glycosyltransferase involved in cell wall biosynthesis